MHRFVLGVALTLVFAGASFAQTSTTSTTTTPATSSTGPSDTSPLVNPAKPAVHKVAAAQAAAHVAPVKRPTTPQSLRGSRYGGFAPTAPLEPPKLDLTSPRSLSLTNINSGESINVTYWSDGSYHRDALDQLNHFLRDVKTNEQTEMDPHVLDVLWHTMQIVGFHGTVDILSAYRSPQTNAWLASVSRGVASDSQHMNGNAMDIRLPGVPVFKIRQAARSLQMGGVGFYPRSGFVHIDTGSIRYW
jgi:uncharacterized protein YcbK (DUF882 family)